MKKQLNKKKNEKKRYDKKVKNIKLVKKKEEEEKNKRTAMQEYICNVTRAETAVSGFDTHGRNPKRRVSLPIVGPTSFLFLFEKLGYK